MRPERFGIARLLRTAVLLALAAGPAAAQDAPAAGRRAVMQTCRGDYLNFCRGVPLGGGNVARCLREHAAELSPECRAAAGAARAAQSPPAGQAAARVLRNIPYGEDPRQRLDLHLPPRPENAPVILMVHGGAWMGGSRSAAGVVANKAAHWLPRGVIFVSIGYRLLPDADPQAQAADVAAALAAVQRQARGWGGDPARVVLMGHSSGAHLIALLAADPAIAASRGAAPWRATVALDSAAYDVGAIMARRHPDIYDRAFGADPEFWRRASPAARLAQATAPMLLVCSSRRRDACPAAEDFACRVRGFGSRAEVLPVALTHDAIDADLGQIGAYTDAVDRFLGSVGLR
jgi:acetyl esterase/lipase